MLRTTQLVSDIRPDRNYFFAYLQFQWWQSCQKLQNYNTIIYKEICACTVNQAITPADDSDVSVVSALDWRSGVKQPSNMNKPSIYSV